MADFTVGWVLLSLAWAHLPAQVASQQGFKPLRHGEIRFAAGGRDLHWVVVTQAAVPEAPTPSFAVLDDNKKLISAQLLYTPDGKYGAPPDDPVLSLSISWNFIDNVLELDGLSLSYGRLSASYDPRDPVAPAKCTIRGVVSTDGSISGSGQCTAPEQPVTRFTFSAAP